MKTIQVDYENKLETLKVRPIGKKSSSFAKNGIFFSYNYPMKKLE
jgi:hypothetical protein